MYLNTNSVDPDQTPASDLGIHRLPVSLFGDTRHSNYNQNRDAYNHQCCFHVHTRKLRYPRGASCCLLLRSQVVLLTRPAGFCLHLDHPHSIYVYLNTL